MLVIVRQHFLPPAAPAISYLAVIVIITIIIGFLKVMKDLKLIWLNVYFSIIPSSFLIIATMTILTNLSQILSLYLWQQKATPQDKVSVKCNRARY